MKELLINQVNKTRFECPYCKIKGMIKNKNQKNFKKDFYLICLKCKEKIYVKVSNGQNLKNKTIIETYFSDHDFSDLSKKYIKKGNIVTISKLGISVEYHEKRRAFIPKTLIGEIYTYIFSISSTTQQLKVRGMIVDIKPTSAPKSYKMDVRFYELSEYQQMKIGYFLMNCESISL